MISGSILRTHRSFYLFSLLSWVQALQNKNPLIPLDSRLRENLRLRKLSLLGRQENSSMSPEPPCSTVPVAKCSRISVQGPLMACPLCPPYHSPTSKLRRPVRQRGKLLRRSPNGNLIPPCSGVSATVALHKKVGRDRPGFAQGYAGQAAARPLHPLPPEADFFHIPAFLPSKIQNPKSTKRPKACRSFGQARTCRARRARRRRAAASQSEIHPELTCSLPYPLQTPVYHLFLKGV